jgi:hypothetical protein
MHLAETAKVEGVMEELFEPFTINGVQFRNRVLRSSLGGRTSYYDGTVSLAFISFENRFAKGGVGGIITATISVNPRRMSPLEYPALHDDRYIAGLSQAARAVQAYGCRYIIQIGDPGGHTHLSLFPEEADGRSASTSLGYLEKTKAGNGLGRNPSSKTCCMLVQDITLYYHRVTCCYRLLRFVRMQHRCSMFVPGKFTRFSRTCVCPASPYLRRCQNILAAMFADDRLPRPQMMTFADAPEKPFESPEL